MLKLDIVTNIVSTLIECTIYTAILNAYWKYESKYRYVVSTLAAALFFVVGFFFSDSPVLQMVLGVAVIIGYSMIVMRGGLWQSVTIALVLLINTLLVNLATNLCVEILSWYRGAEQIINTNASKMAYVAFNRMVFIIVFYIWGRLLAKRRMIKREEWLMLAVYFIADSVAAVALILWTYVRHFDGRDYIYVLAIEISIIVMTVVPLAIANSISYKNEYEKRNELANLKLQAQRADIIRMDKEYQDIRKIRMSDLREEIGFVPQKGVLFSGTIASNLRFGRDDATDEEIRLAAEIAQASEFIDAKDDKYDSAIAQGGTNVSGGQKQRLCIARAIAKNPKIFIFDDSFSALDLKTDAALRKALSDNVTDCTVIIVAQRISTILHADQILVLDDGRIVGKGTHEELMKSCEVYQQIAKSQLSAKELGLEESEVASNE